MSGLLRGEVARMAQLNMETIRYYENYGLIDTPSRTESGYRLYSEEVLTRLAFIKNAKECGFSLKEIRKALKAGKDSIRIDDFIALIDRKVNSIESEIAKQQNTINMLIQLRTSLEDVHKHPEIQQVLEVLGMEQEIRP
ncbi:MULTISPECIES: MerR family transcriptional regulator [Paenibacillus]|uniref:MerR family transcriptional regulator n=1 Tax=Paenibacillus TaxID=44249 RepID=UPI000AF2584F|nr:MULTISPECIES: MerR family transcriptional regulator [Paenibacillus]GIP20295.1 Hg(II)-responsive transcriptional regulator [Paenibacillus sp. J22TS3]